MRLLYKNGDWHYSHHRTEDFVRKVAVAAVFCVQSAQKAVKRNSFGFNYLCC